MITRVGMAPRIATTTPEQCLHHWRTDHADAAGKIPNVRSYVQNHPILAGGRYQLPYPGFDVCSELDFDSLASMDEGFASPVFQRDVRADEDAFIEKPKFSLVLGMRHLLAGSAPVDQGVKRMWLLRAHPKAGRAALLDAINGPMAAALQRTPIVRLDVVETLAAAHEGRDPAAFDAIVSAWFASAADVLIGDDVDLALAGRIAGRADWLATPHRVV